MGNSTSKTTFVFVLAATSLSNGASAGQPWGVPPAKLRNTATAMITIRGGDEAASTTVDAPPAAEASPSSATTTDAPATEEPSLDEKVYAAMKKLGMSPPEDEDGDDGMEAECKDGVCLMPDGSSTPTSAAEESTSASASASASTSSQEVEQQDPNVLADSIAKDMDVDSRLAMAAIGATSTFGEGNRRVYNESAARAMIQYELDLIEKIPNDDPNVRTLVDEGFDSFLSRRALAFAEGNMEDARAILIADQLDEEEEEAESKAQAEDEEAAMRAQLRAEREASNKAPDLVEVKANFDPTTLPMAPKAAAPKQTPPSGMPKPAAKESVVFEATTAQIQELVLESPVPVLLDIYADWCGPCKVLGPALEEMAVKSGGAFRLVKINSDNERPVSGALEVTALPTVFGIRDGKIVHMFQGMPRSEDMMKNFMMGLFGVAAFKPAVTAEESEKYKALTSKLVKTAGAACFSFSARERLTERITLKLDDLCQDDSVPDVEGAAGLLRTLMNNIINDPYAQKYRKVNLENKLIVSKISGNTNALGVLKSVGFSKSGTELILGKGKKIINVAPLVVARDCIDKWIQKNRNEMAAAARKRKDEADRAKLQAEMEAAGDQEDVVEEEEEEYVDPTACSLKLRIDGKKKVHEVVLNESDPLSSILNALEINSSSDEEVQITCVAKRLVVKSSDDEQMKKSLKEHGLMPSAAVVVKIGGGSGASTSSSSLKDRAAEKKKKKGSHTMQSVGIYSKDDNNKAELIDGGGGVWYEHDVSDDEEEAKEEPKEEESKQTSDDSAKDLNETEEG